MAVSIRLRREGTKNSPYYKVVVADRRSPRDGKFIEIIGAYDPKKPGHNSTLKIDRVEYWIGKGAQPSDTVRSLIKQNKKATTPAEPSLQVERGVSQSAQEEPAPPPPPSEPPG
jgi:small subunit ribosomal protein S16